MSDPIFSGEFETHIDLTHADDVHAWQLMLGMARPGTEAERRAVMRLSELTFNKPAGDQYWCERCYTYHQAIGKLGGRDVVVCPGVYPR